jgi:hypothetical protein
VQRGGCYDFGAGRATAPPGVSEQTLRDVLGGAGWDIDALAVRRAVDGSEIEIAFWYVRKQRR